MNMPLSGPLVAMALGVVGSSVVYLSKGVMRAGITRRHRLLYLLGMVMNFTNPLWVIVANRYAPTVYFTSMYGIGLVPLILYAHRALGEELTRRTLLGMGVIAAATILVGFDTNVRGAPALGGFPRSSVALVAALWFVAWPGALALLRRPGRGVQEFMFGVAAGGMAALEALVKGVAQTSGGVTGFVPSDPFGWVLFATSFLGAAGAFLLIQWSILRNCRAAYMAATYDITYVALPVFTVQLLHPGGSAGVITIAGLALFTIGGIVTAGSAPTAGAVAK